MFCLLFFNRATCILGFQNYFPILYRNTISAIVNPNLRCSQIGFCEWPKYSADPNDLYIQRVLKGKPINTKPIIPENPDDPYRIMVINDIHPDPLYFQVRYII